MAELQFILLFLSHKLRLRHIKKLRCLSRTSEFLQSIFNELHLLLCNNFIEVKGTGGSHASLQIDHKILVNTFVQNLFNCVARYNMLLNADNGSMDQVFKLSNITGPIVLRQSCQCAGIKLLIRPVPLAVAA